MERHHSSPHTTGPAVALTLSDTDGQGQAPGRIQLFPAGTFAARDGRPGNLRGVNATSWRLTAQDAEAVIAHWQRTATPLVVDYEHQTQLAAQNGQPAPAAGWITSLEWEEGRGLFAAVDWTDKARAHIRAGEYRYISPVFAFDRQSGAVLRLICAALTNHPALDGMDAASATFTPYEEPPMKQILAALGLPETADEAAALAALTTLRQERDSAKAQAEAAPDPQKFVAMATFSAVQKEAAQLRDELTKLKNEAQAAALKDDIEAVVALHQEIVDQQETQLALLQSDPYNNCYVTFDYDMQDGRTLRRRFTINGTCELARKFDTLYNSPGFLLSREVIPGELKQSDFAGGAIQGYGKNNEPYYYNLSSKEAYELYTTCILPDLGDSSMGVRHYVNFPTMETAEYSWVDISVELDMSDSWVPSDLRSSRIEATYSANYYYDLTADATRSLAYAEAHGFLVP